MYHFPHSYALFPNNLRIPATTPTYPPSPTQALPFAHSRILSRAPTYPPSRTHAPSLAHLRILPGRKQLPVLVGGRILSRAHTYPPSRTHAPSLAHLRILSHAPTHPLSRTYASLPLLQVDAPLLIPIQSLTTTKISSELRAPTSPSHALLPLLIRTFPPSYTYILDLLYVHPRPLVRTFSTNPLNDLYKSLKRVIQIL